MSEQTVLEQANAALDEARKVLAESNENLSKSIRFTDQALINQRSLILAMSNLLPRPIQVDMDCDLNEAEKVEGLAIDLAKNMKTREVFDIVHAINVLAVTNNDVVHIFVNYDARINCLAVFAFSPKHDYENGDNSERLLDKNVWLSHDYALKRLLAIETQLTELIIEAREQAEAKVEVKS